MCDGKMEKGTASAVAAIACGCDRDDKMERGEKGTASVVAAIRIAAIAMAARINIPVEIGIHIYLHVHHISVAKIHLT